jgi:hypothetical protein
MTVKQLKLKVTKVSTSKTDENKTKVTMTMTVQGLEEMCSEKATLTVSGDSKQTVNDILGATVDPGDVIFADVGVSSRQQRLEDTGKRSKKAVAQDRAKGKAPDEKKKDNYRDSL